MAVPRSEPLLLYYEDLDQRSERFFAGLKSSPDRFGRFIANPAGEIAQSMFDGQLKLPPQEADRANRIVYALLSNPRFLAWARDYQRGLIREIGRKALAAPTRRDAKRTLFQMLGKRRIYLDFAKGMKEFGDEELFYAMGLRTPGVELGSVFQPNEIDITVVLVQSVVVFVQTILVVDQGLAIHQDVATQQSADAHGVSHVDVFFINDHVMFTSHDFFVDHSAHANSEVRVDVDASSEAAMMADTDANSDLKVVLDGDPVLLAAQESATATESATESATSSQSSAESGSSSEAHTSSESSAAQDARSEAESASDASSQADAEADHGSEADASAFMNLFGMSRWELQQFAAVVAQAVSLQAQRLREAGALTAPQMLNQREREA